MGCQDAFCSLSDRTHQLAVCRRYCQFDVQPSAVSLQPQPAVQQARHLAQMIRHCEQEHLI